MQTNIYTHTIQGQAYNYDDHGLTEEWMVNFASSEGQGGKSGSDSAPSDDEIVRLQCR